MQTDDTDLKSYVRLFLFVHNNLSVCMLTELLAECARMLEKPTSGQSVRSAVIKRFNKLRVEQKRAENALTETASLIPGACLTFVETIKTFPNGETFTVKKAIIPNYAFRILH